MITYYSLWLRPGAPFPDGARLTPEELLGRPAGRGLREPLPRLVDQLATITQRISGHDPDAQERHAWRRTISHLRQSGNAHRLDERFTYGALPHLLAGFDAIHPGTGATQDGKNTLAALDAVIASLLDGADARTYLCGHRELRSIAPDSLRSHVKADEARRALNLLAGIITNTGGGSLTITQPTGTADGAAHVFPTILMQYAVRGALDELLGRLDAHQDELRALAAATPGANITVESLDTHLARVTRAAEAYGDWKRMSAEKLELLALDGDPVAETAFYLTLPQLERLRELYPSPERLSASAARANRKKTNPEIHRLLALLDEPRTQASRALEETLFYHCWGALGEPGLAVEVDHDRYQDAAFKHGYGARNAPLLFARRTEEKRADGPLKHLNVRQFWR